MAMSPGGLSAGWKVNLCAERVVETRDDSIVASSVGSRVRQKANCLAEDGAGYRAKIVGWLERKQKVLQPPAIVMKGMEIGQR